MSPKGGIKPHKRFSIQAKRSEVLFVDYMAEHLTPTGRAGIIVPEGIIFQSQTAYKELRKMLVDSALVAVISLPAGVFQPYSGVKTSILILDKSLAKQCDTVAFFKVENDGFGLGAQRRANDGEQLTQVAKAMKEFLGQDLQDQQDENQKSCKSCKSCLNDLVERGLALVVPKEKIAANGDYNLSGERYRENGNTASLKWPMIELGKVARLINGRAYKQEELLAEGPTPVLRVGNLFSNRGWYYSDLELEEDKYCNAGDLLYAWSASFGPRIWEGPRAIYHYHIWKIEPTEAIDKMFLHHLLALDSENIKSEGNGIAMVHATKGGMEQRKFPLPPLDVQKEIVAEIEGYQKVINGARAVLDNYRPHISIHPDWPIMELGEVCDIKTGKLNSNASVVDGAYPFFTCSKEVFQIDNYAFDCEAILLSGNNASGDFDVKHYCGKFNAYQRTYVITVKSEFLDRMTYGLLKYILNANLLDLKQKSIGGLTRYLTLGMITSIKLPIPPFTTQQDIVAEIEAEQFLVNGNRELIERFEKKIQATLARIWGEEEQVKGDHPPTPSLKTGGGA